MTGAESGPDSHPRSYDSLSNVRYDDRHTGRVAAPPDRTHPSKLDCSPKSVSNATGSIETTPSVAVTQKRVGIHLECRANQMHTAAGHWSSTSFLDLSPRTIWSPGASDASTLEAVTHRSCESRPGGRPTRPEQLIPAVFAPSSSDDLPIVVPFPPWLVHRVGFLRSRS